MKSAGRKDDLLEQIIDHRSYNPFSAVQLGHDFPTDRRDAGFKQQARNEESQA